MKICLYTDVHWSATSSLVNMTGRMINGKPITKRLELLVDSMNWVEQLAVDHNCDLEICLGDFCDKATMTGEEIEALNYVKWNQKFKYFIVGNHESSRQDLQNSTTNILKIGQQNNIEIVTNPKMLFQADNTVFFALPYITESIRRPLAQIMSELAPGGDEQKVKRIILSHNEIAGINYGAYVSRLGFSMSEISDSCDLFLNGHLHNQQQVAKNIWNIGSLSAHNFTNDSFNYNYGAWILDTTKNSMQFFENPASLQFYKLDIEKIADMAVLDSIKKNAVLSVRCAPDLLKDLHEKLSGLQDKIITTKVISLLEQKESAEDTAGILQDLKVNHLEKLLQFCKAKLPNTDVLEAELAELCK